MGLMDYHLRDLFKQRDTKGSKAPAAQQMAVMAGQYDNGYEDDGSADNELLSEENTPASGQAEGSGFRGWVDGLFAEDINFSFHGTRIKGKDKRQVKGGLVPLFDGVILDLTQASMTGTAEGERQTVRPLEGGTPALLVVKPARRDTTTKGHIIKDFVITAPKKGSVDGFSAEITEWIRYDLGDDVSLYAKGAAICEKLVVLVDPWLRGVKGDGEIAGAMIDENGIRITPKAASENTAIERNTKEVLEQGPGESQASESQPAKAQALESQTEKLQALESQTEKVQTVESQSAKAQEPESKPSGDQAQKAKPSENKSSGTEPSKDKKDAGDKKGDDGKKDDDDDKDGDGIKVNIDTDELSVSVEKGETKLAVNGKTRSVEFENGDLKAKGSADEKTFKISWGKDWSSKKDDDKEKDKKEGTDKKEETESKEDTNVKKALQEYYEKIEEKSKEVLDKAGFARDALREFFETGKLPENKYEKKEEEKTTGSIPLAEILIIPGISFGATLKPSWSFGFHFDFGLEKKELPEIEVKVKKGEVTDISCPAIERVLSLTAEVKGSIGATLCLALEVGAGYILSASGGINATGKARGTIDKSENIFGRGQVQIPLTINGSDIKAGDAELDLKAGIGIMGSVGAELSVGSKLFDWEKELWSYTFKEWNPANLEGNFKLKQDGKGEGGLFSPHSWALEEKTFSLELFKMKIEKSQKYGITMFKESEKTKLLIEQGKQASEKIKELHEKLNTIKEEIGKGGGQVGTEGNEAYDNLMKELKGIAAYLNVMVIGGSQRIEALGEELDKLENSEEYLSSRKKVQTKISTHKDRYEGMKTWGEGEEFEGKEKERNDQAYQYYKKTYHAKRAVKRQVDAREEAAKRKLASKKNLIEYEEKKILSLGKDYDDRIKKLEDKMTGMAKDDKKKANPDFLRFYRHMNEDILIDDEDGLFKNWQRYAGKDRIIAYEEERRDEYKKKHTKRFDDLKKKATELNISDLKAPNRAFVEYYHKEMKAKRFFSEEELLHNHQNGKEIVEYEENRLDVKSGAYMGRIKTLEKYKKEYDEAESKKDKDRILENARKAYQDAKGELGNKLKADINIAKAASKEDILAYEKKKADMDEDGKLPKDYTLAKKALEILRKDGEAGIEKHGIKLANVDSLCKSWLQKNLKDDKVLEDVIPLAVLQDFERQKIAGIEKKVRNSLRLTRKEKREDAFAEKIKGNREYYDRTKWLEDMDAYVSEAKNLEGPDKDAAILDQKKKYFELYFKGEEGENDKKQLMYRLKHGTSLYGSELRKVVLERKLEEYGKSHKERVKKLGELMEPKEGKPAATDAQVWDAYRGMDAGRGFADYYAKEKKGKFSIDEMLRYEQYEARAHSGKNAFKTFVQNKVEEKVEKDGKKKVEKKEELAKGGHYDRYYKLKAKLDSNASGKEIAELYVQLGGGAGYIDWLMSGDRYLNAVTPQEILDYEEKWSGKKGQKHNDRLDKLKEFGKGLSDEEFYDKYREMVLKESDGKTLLDKVAGIEIGFDKSVNAEDVLTPEILVRHEKKTREEALKKHIDRLERLKKDDVTDENALEIYRTGGGGRGFFDNESFSLDRVKANMGTSADFKNILDYEQKRMKYYEKAKEEMDKPLERIREEQKKQKEQVKQAKIDIEDIEEMWEKYDTSGNQAYKSDDSFRELVDDATGTGVQEKVNNGILQMQNLSETVSRMEENELKQAQNAQTELLLMEDEEDIPDLDEKLALEAE